MTPSIFIRTTVSPTLVALLAGVLLAGCGGDATAGDDDDGMPLENAPIVGCPGAALIGVLDDPSEDCGLDGRVPAGWEAIRTFEGANPNLANFGPAPGALGGFCSYTPTFDAKPSDYDEMLAAIAASPHMPLDSVGTDCSGQAPQAGINTDEVRAALGAAFRANLDWVDPMQLGATQSARTPVSVGVVDTVSREAWEDPNIMPNNEHGLQMTALIRDIACPGGDISCTGPVFTTLGLPREDWESGADWIHGGEFGTQGDMAAAIYEAVAAWQTAREVDPNAPPRLIL
ncbi:MAG: hypothetical protein KC457_17935, partial [Myxococcales bacterium]|nr:hypothetical protein [Myxococcales bacterium]